MAAANFSRDVLEMFYGPIEESQGLIPPIRPTIMGEFEIVRNNFDQWLRVWKMQVTKNNKDLFKFFQKTRTSFINVCTNEVEVLAHSYKIPHETTGENGRNGALFQSDATCNPE